MDDMVFSRNEGRTNGELRGGGRGKKWDVSFI